MIKIPMQMLVLSVGVMVFVFYQFNQPPLHFNQANRAKLVGTAQATEYARLEGADALIFKEKKQVLETLQQARKTEDPAGVQVAIGQLQILEKQRFELLAQSKTVLQSAGVKDANDKDYVFINFVLSHIPVGLVGLMLAMIFCASWSTTSSELSALSATSVSDIYRRSLAPGKTDAHYLLASKIATVIWGGFIVAFAIFASLSENLIQAVNMIGSMFYGTILGIFFTAFFLKSVNGRAIFYAALVGEAIVLVCFWLNKEAFLWYNPLGCGAVMGAAWLFQKISRKQV
jgi:Na+(H+)/acetate symporter ActP